MKFSEKVHACRKKAGISQEELAFELGVSRQAVSKWETGESEPDISRLRLLSSVFQVSIDWLLDDDAGFEEAPPPERPAAPDVEPPEPCDLPGPWVTERGASNRSTLGLVLAILAVVIGVFIVGRTLYVWTWAAGIKGPFSDAASQEIAEDVEVDFAVDGEDPALKEDMYAFLDPNITYEERPPVYAFSQMISVSGILLLWFGVASLVAGVAAVVLVIKRRHS